jgi:hypothetical protein
VLWKAAAQLSPVGQKSSDEALADPEGRGSIVEWIMGESIEHGVWFAKKTLKREEEADTAETESDDEESNEPPHEPLKGEENVDQPKKAARKTSSKRKAAASPAS